MRTCLAALCFVSLLGCSSSPEPDPPPVEPDTDLVETDLPTDTDADTDTTPPEDTGIDTGIDTGQDSPSGPCTGHLEGQVGITEFMDCDPAASCRGDILIGVFEDDPSIDPSTPMIDSKIIKGANPSPGAYIGWQLPNVSCGIYHVFAFIDANESGSTQPDEGDIYATEIPQVSIPRDALISLTLTIDERLVVPPPNCGDGVVDFAQGEMCDDGNLIDGDGCEWTCEVTEPYDLSLIHI